MIHGFNKDILKKYINVLSNEQLIAIDKRDLLGALSLGVTLDQYIELIT